MSQWRIQEYQCPEGHRFESLEARRDLPEAKECECGRTARCVISAPKLGTVWGAAASMAKSDERPGPMTLDTRAIADGKMTTKEWKEARRKAWRGRDYAKFKREVG